MTSPRPRSRQAKQLDAGMFQAEISSSALRLAAEGKIAKTIRTAWEQVSSQDIQRWMAHLLDRYSSAYASNRTVKIGHQAAPTLDRYLRARSRHAQALLPQLWPAGSGINPQVDPPIPAPHTGADHGT